MNDTMEQFRIFEGEHLIMLKTTGSYGVKYLTPNPKSETVVRMVGDKKADMHDLKLPPGFEIGKRKIYSGPCLNVYWGKSDTLEAFNDTLLFNGNDVTDSLKRVSWRDVELV